MARRVRLQGTSIFGNATVGGGSAAPSIKIVGDRETIFNIRQLAAHLDTKGGMRKPLRKGADFYKTLVKRALRGHWKAQWIQRIGVKALPRSRTGLGYQVGILKVDRNERGLVYKYHSPNSGFIGKYSAKKRQVSYRHDVSKNFRRAKRGKNVGIGKHYKDFLLPVIYEYTFKPIIRPMLLAGANQVLKIIEDELKKEIAAQATRWAKKIPTDTTFFARSA